MICRDRERLILTTTYSGNAKDAKAPNPKGRKETVITPP